MTNQRSSFPKFISIPSNSNSDINMAKNDDNDGEEEDSLQHDVLEEGNYDHNHHHTSHPERNQRHENLNDSKKGKNSNEELVQTSTLIEYLQILIGYTLFYGFLITFFILLLKGALDTDDHHTLLWTFFYIQIFFVLLVGVFIKYSNSDIISIKNDNDLDVKYEKNERENKLSIRPVESAGQMFDI